MNVGGGIWNVGVCMWRFTMMILDRGHKRTIRDRDWMRGMEARGGGEKKMRLRAAEDVLFLHVRIKTTNFQTQT